MAYERPREGVPVFTSMRPPQRRGGNLVPGSARSQEAADFNEAPPKAGGKYQALANGGFHVPHFNEAPPKAGGKCGRVRSNGSRTAYFNEAPPKAGGKFVNQLVSDSPAARLQ